MSELTGLRQEDLQLEAGVNKARPWMAAKWYPPVGKPAITAQAVVLPKSKPARHGAGLAACSVMEKFVAVQMIDVYKSVDLASLIIT